MVISDLKATTFKAFHQARRLLYPIIHTTEEFVAVLAELRQELQRRKALFKPYPTVETLMDYNKLSDEPLPVIVIFVDEITNLFMAKETQVVTLEMLREARAMARLSHPNVVAVHDAGLFHGRLFLAMEHLDGGSLADWLRARAGALAGTDAS